MQPYFKSIDPLIPLWRRPEMWLVGILLVLTIGVSMFLRAIDQFALDPIDNARLRSLERADKKQLPIMYVKDLTNLNSGSPIFIGSTFDEVKTGWGEPERIHNRKLLGGTVVWQYRSVRLHFRNGVLVEVDPPTGVTIESELPVFQSPQ